METYKTHRPTSFDGIYGQQNVVQMLRSKLKANDIPHTLMLQGPSGCGKTTIARILARELGCVKRECVEINAATDNGVATVRAIEDRIYLAPTGKCRVWILDECHQLTSQAQAALLKITEETPGHVYFMMATTDPQKIIPTLRSRATPLKIELIGMSDMAKLIINTNKALKRKQMLSTVLNRIIEVAEGSARKALVLLDQITPEMEEKQALDLIQSSDSKQEAIEICRTLCRPNASWADMQKVLAGVKEEPERLRLMVLSYANKLMLSQPKPGKAFYIIQAFRDPFYNGGAALLSAACFEVLTAGK